MLIDLGRYDSDMGGCCVEPAKPKKKEKHYPFSYIDGIKDLDIDSLEMEKDMIVEVKIRITSAKKRVASKDGKKTSTVDLNYDIKSIDFSPGKKKKSAKDGDSIQDAIMEALD